MRLYQKRSQNFVSASSMTDKVKLLAPSIAAPDSEATSTTTYTEQQTVWGDFRPGAGARTLTDMGLIFNNVAKIYIYFGVVINSFYKVQINGVTYTIHSLNDYENKHEYYEIVCYTNE